MLWAEATAYHFKWIWTRCNNFLFFYWLFWEYLNFLRWHEEIKILTPTNKWKRCEYFIQHLHGKKSLSLERKYQANEKIQIFFLVNGCQHCFCINWHLQICILNKWMWYWKYLQHFCKLTKLKKNISNPF